MGSSRGVGRDALRAAAAAVALGAVASLSGCSQATPDEAAVSAAVSRLPGVRAVDASFTARSLGNSGDQRLQVTLAPGTAPSRVEDLVDDVRREVDEVEHGTEYDEFVLVDESARRDEADLVTSSFGYGRAAVTKGLAERWATAVSRTPPGGIRLQSWPDARPVSASISSHEPVSASLAWVLASGLGELSWGLVEYQTGTSPYARFSPDGPLTPAMVRDWVAIEETYAGEEGCAVVSRAVVVEDHDGLREVRVSVAVPGVAGALTPGADGALVWPTVDATYRTRPPGHGFELQLHRDDHPQGELVDAGRGDAGWEAAHRQRFPAAVSAPPT
ncbi:hypothetical protein [Knoellia aerolata]|uniref:Uncharacterized protein n=1 Tax=Knoellia aerolata DSM 18566 TaxID=1385519 RepID=A0A0A0JX57_9MICO|nr:hypothetical protein [Knoellia aerolata]KGN41299.1 hypothetical protein N801_08540 [Knoellia aerolata DSM 18566]